MRDGEGVILKSDGVSDFDRLRSRRHDNEMQILAFDVLEIDGADLHDQPLDQRKAALAKLLRRSPRNTVPPRYTCPCQCLVCSLFLPAPIQFLPQREAAFKQATVEKLDGRFMIRSRTRIVKRHAKGRFIARAAVGRFSGAAMR